MRNSNDLVSIILPVYNGSKFLKISLESILNQTYQNLELIIVNDGSTDNSHEIIEHYIELDSRINYIKNNSNLGLPKSLNIGIEHSKGVFITWTSDDNIYYSSAISVMVSALVNSDLDFVYCDCDIIDNSEQKIGLLKTHPIEHLIFGNIVFHCWLHKRKLFDEIGSYDVDLVLIEDYDYWLRIAKRFKMLNINNVLYSFRFHDSSLTHSIKTRGDQKTIFESNKKKMFQKVLEDLNPERKSHMKFLLNPWNTIFESMKSHKLKMLFNDYLVLVSGFKSFNSKYSTRLFAFQFFDIAVRNPEFHNLSLLKLLFANSKLMFNLSVKQNLVLIKKAIIG